MWARDMEIVEKYQAAIEAADEVLKREEKNSVAYAIKGAALAELGEMAEAISAFDNALQINPTYEWAWWEKGRAFYLHQDLTHALETYLGMAELEGDAAARAALGQAVTLRALGQTAAAEQALGRTLGEPPPTAEKLMDRAYDFDHLQAWREAINDCATAFTLDPENGDAYNLYAWLKATKYREDLEDCVEKAEKSIACEQKLTAKANNLDTLGWVWYLSGDLPMAHPYLKQAVELKPPDLLIRDHLRVVEEELKSRGKL
jgi:tetratricopeptide (TPR) repeat protein